MVKIKAFSQILILLISIIALSSFSLAAGLADSDFQVTLEEQTPSPVEPGEVVTLEFKVENEGVETANNIIVSIVPEYPLSLYQNSGEENIGSMRANEVVGNIEFDLLVDDNAAQGSVEVELRLGEEGKDDYYVYTFDVDIETRDAVLDITDITITPEQVSPGEKFNLDITLTNEADSLLQSITATVNTSSDQPIVAYLSSSEKVISLLSSKESTTLNYELIVDPSFEHGLYRVPFELEYEDRNGNSYNSLEYISLFVTGETQIDLQVRSSALYTKDKSGKVVFELANLGQGELKAVQLEVMPGNDYEVISSQSNFYIGNVDSDDTETEEVVLKTSSKDEFVSVLIKIDYLDALNKEYSEEFNLMVPIYEMNDAVELGLAKKTSYTGLIIVVVLGLIGISWYRKKKGKPSITSIIRKKLKKRK